MTIRAKVWAVMTNDGRKLKDVFRCRSHATDWIRYYEADRDEFRHRLDIASRRAKGF